MHPLGIHRQNFQKGSIKNSIKSEKSVNITALSPGSPLANIIIQVLGPLGVKHCTHIMSMGDSSYIIKARNMCRCLEPAGQCNAPSLEFPG